MLMIYRFFLYIAIPMICSTRSKVHRWIDLVDREAPDKIIAAPDFNRQSLAFKRDKSFDACKSARKPCENGGECVAKDGNFYCICPTTHFGKTCEHIADQSHCADHLCANNATCVSTRDNKKVVNSPVLANFRAARGNSSLNSSEIAQIYVSVAYDCICRPGFFGALCDVPEEVKSCEEDYCMNRGQGIVSNGTCKCQCEKQYFGKRCEQISACFEFKCENGGICEDVIDMHAKTITAFCKCPRKVEVIGSTTSAGDRCEKHEIPQNVPQKHLPCMINSTSFKFINFLLDSIDSKNSSYASDIKELQNFRDSYESSTDLQQTFGMTTGWCEHMALCVPTLVRMSSSRYYLLHRCECSDPLQEGNFCEYTRKDACEVTREEKKRGITVESRCTDLKHGHCVDHLGHAKCICRADYVGEACENFDPCARKPCKHGDCVPITDEVEETDGKPQQSYQCLCPINAALKDGTNCVQTLEGDCTPTACKNGRCVTCNQKTSDDVFNICNERELAQGYRCICEAGFAPPTCRHSTNACYHNLCAHASRCVPDGQHSYNCICLNGTSGSLCERVDNACEAFGELVCEHGECVNDEFYRRGFSCQCRFGYYGMNCELSLGYFGAFKREFKIRYNLVIPMTVCFFCVLCLLVVLLLPCSRRIKREVHPKPTP